MSFAIKPASAVPNEQPDAPRAVGFGVAGGSRGVRLDAPRAGETGGTDLSLLTQFGGKLIEPLIQRQQEQKFVEGMLRAAGGEAASQIAAERPAWARAYGDDAATLGARKQEALSDAAAFETWVTDQVTEMADKSEQDFAAHIVKGINARRTGDPERDRLFAASVVNYLPTAGRLHAKARIARQQERAEAANAQHISERVAAADSITEKSRQDPRLRDDESYTRAGDNLVSLLAVQPGVNPERHMRRFVDTLVASMHKGQFGSVNMLRERGVFDKLPAEHQDRLIQQEWQQGAKYLPERLRERAPEVADAVLAIRTNTYLDAAALRAAATSLNAQAQMATGIVVPLLSEGQIDQLVIRNVSSAKDRAEAEASARAREAREAAVEAKRDAQHQQTIALMQVQEQRRLQKEASDRAVTQALFAQGHTDVGASLAVLGEGAKQEGEAYVLSVFQNGGPPPDPRSQGRRREMTLDDSAKYISDTLKQYTGTTGPVIPVVQARLNSSLQADVVDAGVARDLLIIKNLADSGTGGRMFSGKQARLAGLVVDEMRAAGDKADLKTVLQTARARERLERSTSNPPAKSREVYLKAWGDGPGAGVAAAILAKAEADASHLNDPDARLAFMKGAAARMGLRKDGNVTYYQDPSLPDWSATFLDGGALNAEEAGRYLETALARVLKDAKLEGKEVSILRVDSGEQPLFQVLFPGDGSTPASRQFLPFSYLQDARNAERDAPATVRAPVRGVRVPAN